MTFGAGGAGEPQGTRVGSGRRRALSLTLAAGVSLCLLTACSGGSGDTLGAPAVIRSATTAPSVPTTPSSAPTPSPAADRTADPDAPITIAFGGDVHFANHVADLLAEPKTSMASLRPRLGRADVAMVNLETAITSRGREQPKTYHFRAPPTALTALRSAGVDVVTMANNHAVDYGPDGLTDTLAAQRRSPIPIVGIGQNAKQAYAPAYFTVRGHTIAVLGATQVQDYTFTTWGAGPSSPGVARAAQPAQLVKAVRRAKERADLVVVYLHWGTERMTCPNARQTSTATALAEAGAGLIVGSHAHRLMGAGWLGNSYVSYGLGNFVWYHRNTVADATTGVLTATFDPRAKRVTAASWQPMMVTGSGLPEVISGANGTRMLKNWNAARSCTGLAAAPAGSG